MIIGIIIAYFVGAIPTGYLLCRWLKGVDIRQCGSGNIGATNIGRVLGKKYFFLVFLIDAGKAWGMLYTCSHLRLWCFGGQAIAARAKDVGDMKLMFLLLVAGALLLGNAYSCFLRFSGGKGVATTVGVISYLYPPFLSLTFCCLWLGVMFLTRHAFVASLVAVAGVGVCAPILYALDMRLMFFLVGIAGWLAFRHHRNIKKWWVGRKGTL